MEDNNIKAYTFPPLCYTFKQNAFHSKLQMFKFTKTDTQFSKL